MIAVTTHSRVKRLRYTAVMLAAGKLIERQLQAAPGCERYANVVAGPREFWTLTIWRDLSQMRESMRDGAHGRLMWKQPRWLDSYWGMRWQPGGYRAGGWEGDEAEAPDGQAADLGVTRSPDSVLPMYYMHAALGQAVPLERRQVAGAAGATYRLRMPPWALPAALRDLRSLRRIAAADCDSFTLSLGVGTGRALYLLVVATSREALDRLRAAPEHRRFLERWGDRAWCSTWEPDSEFGHWHRRKLRDGQLVDDRLLVDVKLPVEPIAAREARTALRTRLEADDGAGLHVLELVVSELVGNSFRNGGLGPQDRIGLQVRAKGDWTRVQVIDRGRPGEPYIPVIKSPSDPGGWDLFLVDQAAERWGIIHRCSNRHVWCELRTPVHERVKPDTTTRFDESFPARPEQLGAVRSALREWLQSRPIPTEKQQDVLLAVSEATANAAQHAYVGRDPGVIVVDVVEDHDEALVHVRDFGRWRPPTGVGDERGRGTEIMKALSSGFARETGQDGTTVTMRLRLRDGAQSSRSHAMRRRARGSAGPVWRRAGRGRFPFRHPGRRR